MLDPDRALALAIALMSGFAERTGVDSGTHEQRYLWTDAFAVCNFLALARATGDERHQRRALQLIERVHHALGRHRSDETRKGWLGAASKAHPTLGGLRIGKPLPERRAEEPYDERLEWDRDGKYFHYLTRWMQALDLTTRATGDPRYAAWARELAESAHAAFVYPTPGGERRMFWKMSIDLSRPQVASMGHHDPLDGYVAYAQISAGPPLARPLADFAAMIEGRDLATSDPLGLGGLLLDARRAQQLLEQGAKLRPHLVEALLGAALEGLEAYAREGQLGAPAGRRLAFRELGLAIGLSALSSMTDHGLGPEGRRRLTALRRYLPLRDEIVSFWIDPKNQKGASWGEHRDINEVMLATSLVPDGCVTLPPVGRP